MKKRDIIECRRMNYFMIAKGQVTAETIVLTHQDDVCYRLIGRFGSSHLISPKSRFKRAMPVGECIQEVYYG
jgi:hypothetical protein